jgi:5-methylcytosine-specific restriction endonuclease McrA
VPSYACTVCGTIGPRRRCAAHPVKRGPSSKVTGRRDWRTIKARVIARDRGICWICGETGADSVDHLRPVSKGGSNRLDNLKAAHLWCNQQRGGTG